jgi:hypothetical protein
LSPDLQRVANLPLKNNISDISILDVRASLYPHRKRDRYGDRNGILAVGKGLYNREESREQK